jgi:hypothetical protein
MHMVSSLPRGRLPRLTLDHRGHDEGDSEVQRRDYDGLSGGCTGECTLWWLLDRSRRPSQAPSASRYAQVPFAEWVGYKAI